MSRLAGKRALVTGASRGIGAAIAQQLAAEGADVAITYERSAEKAASVVKAIEALGRKGAAIAADSADPAAVKRSVDQAAQALGGLDILVNNAGIYRGGPVEDWSLADIGAVVLASQAAAAHLGEGGRIISIGSCLADRVVEPNVTLYAMTKAALIGFTKGLARDFGPRGITVNLVHPGSTDTDMNPADGPRAAAQLARMAIPAYGKPQDIAAAVAYLASEEGRFITGAGLAVDGGVNT